MNDLNTEDYLISPLTNDKTGRFSRKGKKREDDDVRGKTTNLIDTILVILYITFLLAADFIVFAGSGNIEVFRDSILPIPEVSLIIGYIFILACCCTVLFYWFAVLKAAVAAIFSFGVIYILFQQFSQFTQVIEFGAAEMPSYLLWGSLLAILSFALFFYDKILYKLLLVIASGIMFLHVYLSYMENKEPHEFVESHNVQAASETKNKRFIYFMFPNLTSYTYLATIATPESLQTRQIMQGFYQKNNFKIFPKAYAPKIDYLSNMVMSLNPSSEQQSYDLILNTRVLSEYWRFYNLRNEYVYLKNNELFDVFSKNNFQVSAYKSRDFDLCHKQHKYNVQRCIEKVNKPINIYDMKLPVLSRANILLIEWLVSMKLYNDMAQLHSVLTSFVDVDKAPMVGVNYNNLYVVNSTKTFDILLENIKADNGKQAYFVFADLPSDMYIYDEFCQIKPKNEWLDMANLPWITADYTYERSKAYQQQTRCLYGKLQQFMDNMRKDNLLADSVIVLQGTSSVNNFQNFYPDDFIENFINNNLVNMAIYDEKSIKQSRIDFSLCPTTSILTDYLYKTNKCLNKQTLGVHDSVYQSLNSKLNSLLMHVTKDATISFEEWYKKWLNINGLDTGISQDTLGQKFKEDKLVEDNESKDEEEQTVTPVLNDEVFDE